VKVASVGSRYWYQVTRPDYVKHILRTNDRNYGRNKQIKELQLLVGNGVIANDDNETRLQHRRYLQPTFERKHIANFAEAITSATTAMIENRWSARGSDVGEPFELIGEIKRLTLKISGLVFFDAALEDLHSKLDYMVDVSQSYILNRYAHPIKLPANFPTPANIRFQKAKRILDTEIYNLIEAKKGQQQEDYSSQKDVLSLLLTLQAGNPKLTDTQIRDELVSLISAGYDFRAITLAWAWYLIAKHPECQARLQEEVDRVLGGRTPTENDLKNLNYVRNVLQEAMRLYPAYWMILRRSKEADQVGEYEIEADKTISLPIYISHRHPDFWSNPNTFDPARWEAEDINLDNFFGFGLGSHQCIAKHYTLMELQMILAMLIQRYQLKIACEPTVEASINLRPKNGLNVILVKRK
jgi:cytochrome P450